MTTLGLTFGWMLGGCRTSSEHGWAWGDGTPGALRWAVGLVLGSWLVPDALTPARARAPSTALLSIT